MKQGVLTRGRMCLLLSDGYDVIDQELEREEQGCVGCIVGAHLCVLGLVIMKGGEKELLN